MSKNYLDCPLIPEDPLCDGLTHEIWPKELKRVAGMPVYLLEYGDLTAKTPVCQTLLWKKQPGAFTRLPLKNGGSFIALLRAGKIRLTGSDEPLPQQIGTEEPLKDWEAAVEFVVMNTPTRPDRPSDEPEKTCPKRNVFTVYIRDRTPFIAKDAENRQFISIPFSKLAEILRTYDVFWRHTNGSLATDGEIEVLLWMCEISCSSESSDCVIEEEHGMELPGDARRYRVLRKS